MEAAPAFEVGTLRRRHCGGAVSGAMRRGRDLDQAGREALVFAAVKLDGQLIALYDGIYLAQRFPEPVWPEPSMTDRARHGKGARSGSAQPVRAAGEASVRAV